MSKVTIQEVKQAKKELEAKIAKMLFDFEKENDVTVRDCKIDSHDFVSSYMIKEHVVEFSMTVEI